MKKLMVAIAAAAISFAGFADDTNNWFTAGFGDGVTSTGGGWVTEGSVTEPSWNEATLMLADVGADAPVVFAADEAKAGAATNADSTVVFDTTVTFQGFEDLPTIENGAKAGVCALTGGNYYVVAYDDVGLTNKWVDTGFEAAFEVAVNVKVTVANGKAVYSFGADSTESLDLVNAEFQEVCYSGNGSVTTLAADTILAGVAITLPTIDGLSVTCDKVRAAVGAEVTLTFGPDTKIPSIPSAKYIVGADGNLTLKEDEPQVEAQDPGAKIGTVLYLTFADAYGAAEDDYTIVLCANQDLAIDIEKSITVDLAGKVLTVEAPVAINGVALAFEDTAKVDKGKLVISNEFSIADGDAELDISSIAFEVCDEGYLTGVGGTLYVAESPNKLASEGIFGDVNRIPEIMVECGGSTYEGMPGYEVPRFAIGGEVAYATVGEEESQYVESFATVQGAIDAADEVYLCFEYGGAAPEGDEITFKQSTIVYAAVDGDDLAYCTLLPEGEVEFDDTIEPYGAWVYTGEQPTEDIKLSWTENETKMTVLVSIDGDDVVDNPAVVESGDVAEFIVLPKVGYEYKTVPDGWFLRIDGGISNNFEVAEESISVEVPEPTEIPATTVQISLPAATEGVAGYIVSNVTDNVAITADVQEEPVVGGVTYTLTLGTKVEIWVVPADGYRVTGNPYTIDEVTTGTTVDVEDLPSVAAIPYVAQIGDARFETLQEAFASEAEGDIVLLDNVTLTETLAVNKDFVLNLGGKTLTSTLPSVAWAIRLGDSAAITAVISNGTIVANQYGVRANQTDLTLDTVTIDSTLRALQSTTASDIDLVGCTISAAPNAEDEIAVLTKGGTLDLVDTTVNSGAKGLDLGGTVATIDADSVISVDGVNCAVFVGSDAGVKTRLTVAGKVEATASHTSDNDSIYAISGNGTDEIGADVTISEGADISVTADETAIYWPNAGTLTVNGGSIAGGTAIWAKSGNVVVNGGEISANGAAAPYAEDNDGVTPTGDAIVFEKLSGDATGYPNNLTASITGGTITSENGAAVVSVARAGETALGGVVSGGTFSSPIPDTLCAAGFIPMANDDGTYGVKEGAYVAQVGAVKYETVEAALAAVQALEMAGSFPIVITALAEDGLTITDTDRTASIAKDVTITIPSAGTWEVDGTLTYSGAIEGSVTATDIVIPDDGSITLGVDALVTVGLASKLEEASFIAPSGYKVAVMATMETKSFKVEEIPTYAITWTAPENATVVAIDEEGDAVESGDKYSEGCKIAFTVTPKDDFTYAGVDLGTAWTLLESGAISNLVTVGTTAVEVVIPEAVAAAPAWDIPGAEGGINALVKEDGVTKYVEFTSITFTATGATVGLKAAKIAAQAETFGLVCKTDLTKGDTFVINASLSVAEGDPDAKNGLFTISTDLSGYDQLFVVGVGQAKAE